MCFLKNSARGRVTPKFADLSSFESTEIRPVSVAPLEERADRVAAVRRQSEPRAKVRSLTGTSNGSEKIAELRELVDFFFPDDYIGL